MASENDTIESIASEIASSGFDGFFLAKRVRVAHNRETQKLRERIDKLVNQLHENGLEEEDGK